MPQPEYTGEENPLLGCRVPVATFDKEVITDH